MRKKIECLLKDRIGLDVHSIGAASIHNAIKRCLNGSVYSDLGQYYQALHDSEVEFRRLVEAVVVPETWFFRDGVPFDVLVKKTNQDFLMTNLERTLRILSVPCSTGEEPYTIAIALDQIGFPVERMKIDAIDISQYSLEKAKRGVYRENSFRSENLSFRDRYFSKVASGYLLKSDIRKRVNFRQGNLLRDNLIPENGEYDMIFCRNLLIYFDSSDQEIAARKLHKLLAPNGLLFVGHAEANNNINSMFSSLRLRGAFAFVKKEESSGKPEYNYDDEFSKFSKKHGGLPSIATASPSFNVAGTQQSSVKPFSAYVNQKKYGTVCDEQKLIVKARRLADEGDLDEAEKICEEVLSQVSNADAFYLLGVVYEASSRHEEAGEVFRKAIYLVPDHVEALVHLALHLELSGSVDEALTLRRRAERIGHG